MKEESVEVEVKVLIQSAPHWAPILGACIEEARRGKNQFAGAWVFWRLKERGIKAPNNLRRLLSAKILTKVGTARGGKRAYYSMKNIARVEKSLKTLSR